MLYYAISPCKQGQISHCLQENNIIFTIFLPREIVLQALTPPGKQCYILQLPREIVLHFTMPPPGRIAYFTTHWDTALHFSTPQRKLCYILQCSQEMHHISKHSRETALYFKTPSSQGKKLLNFATPPEKRHYVSQLPKGNNITFCNTHREIVLHFMPQPGKVILHFTTHLEK